MFFKRLELSGFKSFGHKTTIEFQEGFTIVVGPNGCGKSNILDAVRWVLGETSAKSLRGGRMGDVVFRGSSSMKPAGLANVTLTCDNERGTLKIDQPEVAVTRRLYASGESEYQLNKVSCRMRDIHEMFLDTGLGADGYSIIEQGQIGQMIAAKPNERRDIFEEAAGISRYKMRREETVRKLARTQDDLSRLQDIVGEVERQCGSLRYQARKAERHRRLTRRLHRLQQRMLVMRHTILTSQYAEAEAKRQEFQRAFEATATQAAQAEAALVAEQEKLEALQVELRNLQQTRYDLRARLDRERHRVEMAGQRIQTIDERLVAIDKELKSRTDRLTIIAGTRSSLESDMAAEEETLANSNTDLQQKIDHLDTVRRENEHATRELERLRGELNELRARENTLLNDKRLAESLSERLRDEMGQTEFQLAELTRQIEEVEAQFNAHRETVAGIDQRLEERRNEARQVQEEIGKDDRAKKELGQRLESLTQELNRATSRLQALVELEESYEGYFRGVKEVMKAADRNEVPGIIGVVSTLLRVPKEYEIAVEVALGSDVQDIVTVGVDAAKQAIAFLKRRNFGRATFLPLDFLHADFPTRHLEPIWGRPGILGLGRDLVEYDPKIQTAVKYLFGNTVFVEHLDVAVNLEREGIRNRFVSLQGDVVNPRGVLSGGSHQTRGLLTRQRDIRQLQETVKVLEGDLKQLRDAMAATKDRLGALYGRAAELQAETHQLEMDGTSARKDLQQAERDLRERRNQRASVEARVNQQRVDSIRQTEIIENCTKGLEELAERLKASTESFQACESEVGHLLTRQQNISEEVAVAREAQRGAAARVAALRERVEEIEQQIADSKADQQAREQERTTLTAEREQALLDRDDAEELLGKLAREFEEADNQANDKNAAIETQGNAIREKSIDAQRFARDRNERDNAVREAQVHTAELRAQIEYLEREAEDEFALTITEIKAELHAAEQAEQEWRQRQEEKAAEEKARKAEEHKAARAAQSEASSEGEEPAAEESTEEAAEKSAEETEKKSTDGDDDEDDRSSFEEGAPVTTPEDDAITEPGVLRTLVTDLRQKLARMGAVNEAAIEEYAKQSERLEFLISQRDDMLTAKEQLEEAIRKIDETTAMLFNDAYEAIRKNFQIMFRRLFNGGEADLVMVEDERYPEPGIEIHASPPGKKITGSITLMSGGEKALTAIALMFSMFQFRPSPICILDEIDAPLDDVNVARLCEALRQFAGDTQFLIITHNKVTMGLADTIYGVTMQEPGVSKVVSVKFDEVEEQGLLDSPAPTG
ncbi:MAG: chromosome segregation protein [Candidatus Sumerlaeota bacterium]|nr:chromosome segregation protein [Candidatus Sumerlaeota bacterium]